MKKTSKVLLLTAVYIVLVLIILLTAKAVAAVFLIIILSIVGVTLLSIATMVKCNRCGTIMTPRGYIDDYEYYHCIMCNNVTKIKS